MSQHPSNSINSQYQQAGVDDQKSHNLMHWLQQSNPSTQPAATATLRQITHLKSPLLHQLPTPGELIQGVGGFASMHQINWQNFTNPTLVTATDGVGTKVLLALAHHQLGGIGQDLVAMCANDLFTLGARPLGFLDYYATSKLDEAQFKTVLQGIKAALDICACALAGGETAQMPGLYHDRDFDLAGFIYGIVDHTKALGAHRVQDGDALYALPASGFHANGFSLLRQWLDNTPALNTPELITQLLTPTELYPEVSYLAETTAETHLIHACAHITGGGLSGNLLRVLPPGATARIELSALPIQPWMRTVIETGGEQPWPNFENVFNLGCGMILAVDADQAPTFEQLLKDLNLPSCQIGAVQISDHQMPPQLNLN